jgi:hypothetical protein
MDNGDEDGKPQLWNIEYLWFIDFFQEQYFFELRLNINMHNFKLSCVFFNLLSTLLVEFLCISLALLLDFQAIKTLSILKFKLFNVLCYVGWLMCLILNLNSRLGWFHSRIYKNTCQIPILTNYSIPTSIWVYSWLGFQKKKKGC